VDKTNSQQKFWNASVGSDQPIEVPDTNQAPSTSEAGHQAEPAREARPTPGTDHRESATHDEPPRRSRRYYDDSDDMIERIRRAREAFERKANAFQGPDWPYYDKRIIVGKKKRPEDSTTDKASQAQPTLPVEPEKSRE
jgi:hypothetical protein